MTRSVLFVLAYALLGAGGVWAQRQPIYVSCKGSDRLGGQFAAALRRELDRSSMYEVAPAPEIPKQGTLFHLSIAMVCMPDKCEEPARRVVANVEIETLGAGAWPLPDVWYMKSFLVGRGGVDRAARSLLTDIGARWCRMSHYSSATAIARCPKEVLPDVLLPYSWGHY
jgi:hypothetical protein